MKDLVVYYRTSDAGYPKDKPSYVNNFSCLYNFLKEFPFKSVNIIVMADNVSDETKEKLKSSSLPKIEELRIWVQRYNEQGRSVGGQAPVTLRRYESLKNGTPNRWYISFGFPF